MAVARIEHRTEDVDLVFEVHADSSFPDAISEVTAAVKRLYDDLMVAES